MRKILKCIILCFFMISILFILRFDSKYINNFTIVNNGLIFATYRNGNVYIGNNEFVNKLKDIKENDIVILDNHINVDPDYKIISSYKITDNIIQNEILNILLEYTRINPSSWNRSMKSMKIEWTAHNLLYYFDYQTIRTRDVDFNNSDENVYNERMLKDIIKKIIKKVYNRLGNLNN